MLSSKNKKIFLSNLQTLYHADSCTYSEKSYCGNSKDNIIDVLVCAICGNIRCAECFDSENNTNDLCCFGGFKSSNDNNNNNHLNTEQNSEVQKPKCTQLFCALFDTTSCELIDASQAFCGHFSHNDDQDECFVCHENICISCRVEHLMRFYCNNCVRRCLFCAKPTEISKASGIMKNIDHISKKIQILQNSICVKCGLPACDDCLDYDFLCPGCSGEQSG